jgi:hypothetical protein
MTNAFASYSIKNNSIIVEISVPNNESIFRFFRLDRGPKEPIQSLKDRAYFDALGWANWHNLTLQNFRAA